ncbi:hemopexin repeat-containing protein [Nonomuraea sp. NPDC050643]|uniref:hemopexin repeat-containing protein n=1 Tax=Nonomuraea sp. NPDC050643 TaxID=3155660 RepID=UPI0033E69832
MDLLTLLRENFAGTTLLERRSDLQEIPLDHDHTFTEEPYLNIVTKVLEKLVGNDPYERLRTRGFPFDMPFSLQQRRLSGCFRHLGISPEDFHRLFAARAGADLVAREFLGLSAEDVEMFTAPYSREADVLAWYGDGLTSFDALHEVERFRRATRLSGEELGELLFQGFGVTSKSDAAAPGRAPASAFFIHQGGLCVTVDEDEERLLWGGRPVPIPFAWFGRVSLFVRLARRTGLSFTDLDVVLRTCCGNRLDLAALRVLAVVVHLARQCDLPIDVACALAAPMDTLGFGAGRDLFGRTFNPAPPPGVEAGPVILPSPGTGTGGRAVLGCAGDLLAPHNAEFRARVARCLAMPEGDLAETVGRFRRRRSTALEPGPFDRPEFGLPALSLLHRVARLARALGVSAGELFDVLEAVESDSALRRHTTFRILLDAQGDQGDQDGEQDGDRSADCYRLLETGDLWLAQTLLAVVRWTQAAGTSGAELLEMLGGPLPERPDVTFVRTVCGEFAQVAADPGMFVSDRFSDRASRVLHEVLTTRGVVSPRDHRLLRHGPGGYEAAAYAALTDLAVLSRGDFLGLGLEDRLSGKIYTGLVLGGHLGAEGTLDPASLPPSPRDLRLWRDYGAHRETLLDLIGGVTGTGEEPASLFPSDLAALEALSEDERAELYDNFVFHGYIDATGVVLRPDLLTDQAFEVNADLAYVAAPVLAVLRERAERFHTGRLTLAPDLFADLPLSEAAVAELIDSLRFNGHVDEQGRYTDKSALLQATDLALAPAFHAHKAAVLDAMKTQISAFRDELYTFTPGDFRQVADQAMAQRVIDHLEGPYTERGRLREDVRPQFAGTDGQVDLGTAFTSGEQAIVFARVAAILREQQPYQLDLAAVAELGFTEEEGAGLVSVLIGDGHLGPGLAVPHARLGHFADPRNAALFTLPVLQDYARDVFLLLHSAALELIAGIAEITGTLTVRAQAQHATLLTVLQDALGAPAASVEAIVPAVAGSLTQALEAVVAPALAAEDAAGSPDDITAVPADPGLRLTYRRMHGFARLAAKLGLDAEEIGVAFRDQDLAGKFPEPLSLPPRVESFDALLEGADGLVYLFEGPRCWIYSAATYALTEDQPTALAEMSPSFAGLTGVDAAFTDASGTEWIIGRDAAGASHAFVRRPGGTRWAPKEQVWGRVRNNFATAERIDSAYADENGRTYLFCGDQYVRYSGPDYTAVDEGYPRGVDEWWDGEGHTTPLPPAFRKSVDACFQDVRDRRPSGGRIHLFTGDRCFATDAAERPITEVWGRIRNTLAETGRLDAAYVDGPALYLFSGDQVVRHTDNVENDGLRAGDGHPRRIEAHLPNVPAEFGGGLEAAFADQDGRIHLFKDGRTTAVTRDGTPIPLTPGGRTVVPTAQRWGLLDPVLKDGAVDSVLVGLDGRTYLFSGARYLRYSGTDYSAADSGHPRAIAGDWGGLRRVEASFVLDRKTYLFGTPGRLFDLPLEQADEIGAGRLTAALRRRFLEHGVSFPQEATVERTGSVTWRLAAERGITLTVTRLDDRFEAEVTDAGGNGFYVRYSTRDYTTPDPGYPRPLADNWWNLPAALAQDPALARIDAVFTGRDERIHLFSGAHFVVFDARRRWWSEVRSLAEHWDSIPFAKVDAAFVGKDGKTYVFSGDRYVRYSGDDYTRVDDRYPAEISPFWGNVANNIARTGRVDAALVLGASTYLFSGNQFVRYEGRGTVEDGYPRLLSALAQEPGFENLTPDLAASLADGIDAAFADRRNVYLARGRELHVVSAEPYRRYGDPGLTCAFVEDGALLTEGPDGWHRRAAIEGLAPETVPVRPRTLRSVPEGFRHGLDAVLNGSDGNTYLFKGPSCFNVRLNRSYPLAQEWGRVRNNVYHGNTVDAAFVGVDGRTYVFSGDQFLVYSGRDYDESDGDPRPIAAHWGGLTSVALAYAHAGRTYLFEPPGPDGAMRHLVYSGDDYDQPDPGYPQAVDASFWGVPEAYRAEGFTVPEAVLFEGETMLLLRGDRVLQHEPAAGTWSYPRPVERVWPGLDLPRGERVKAAFTGADGATYFFFEHTHTRYAHGAFAPATPIRDRWGTTPGSFATGDGTGRVDAAFVHRGATYLFSRDRYARYSAGAGYRYTDPGYPRPILGNLRLEEPFANLPESFDDAVADRLKAGDGRAVDAVVGGDRTVHLFVGRSCHVVSRSATATYDLGVLGRIRNAVAERRKVDAALVTESGAFLFSGDQYVRYTHADQPYADDGYPRTIEGSLAAELGLAEQGLAELPEAFRDGIDAAFRGADGRTYLFKDGDYLRGPETGRIAGTWGRVRNEFGADGPQTVDAAFTGPGGELYVFRRGQYVRYRPSELEHAEQGYPRTVKDDWGDLPAAFEESIDGAFTFRGRTYLAKGGQYVRYSGDLDTVDRTYPQPFRRRWAEAADYRLNDVHVIARFAELARTGPQGPGGLAAFLTAGPAVVEDPYRHLADLFGWDAEELRWLKRNGGFLADAPQLEDRFEIEFLLRAAEVFAAARLAGTGPSALYTDVWRRLYAGDLQGRARAAALAEADTVLTGLLARRAGPEGWPVLARTLLDEDNLRRRDALVSAVLASGSPGTSRELFERLLIDVDMGSRGMTSPVREAIAATQLYLHRYFLDLERIAVPEGEKEALVRARLKTWWGWMRNYRVWEANRKVFLYPENYVRPELRDTKTPAFEDMENDLLQGEITAAAVQRAYKRYLDEYTEVSRLAIAGGYVYVAPGAPKGTRSLVLFGRTRTEPRRLYHRRAEFRDGQRLSTTWGPWRKVDVQIDAEKVYPLHAFDRIFVFWTASEGVPPAPGKTIEVREEGTKREIEAPEAEQHVLKIYYSFQNLTGEWVPAQVLGASPVRTGPLPGVPLSVRSGPLPGQPPGVEHESIIVSCVLPDGTETAFALTPELYAVAVTGVSPMPGREGEAAEILADDEPLAGADVVRFNQPTTSDDLHWLSIDHKGGSFLCRPLRPAPEEPPRPQTLRSNTALPSWSGIDAAFELPDGTQYFFNNAEHKYAVLGRDNKRPGNAKPMAGAWGEQGNNLISTGVVDAVLRRGEHTYVFSGSQYFRYTGAPFGPVGRGYPKDLRVNRDELPQWGRVDCAFTGPDGTEYFFSREHKGSVLVRTGAVSRLAAVGDHFALPDKGEKNPFADGRVDAALVRGEHTFLFAGEQYVRYTKGAYRSIDRGYPRAISSENNDQLPKWSEMGAAFSFEGSAYFFDNGKKSYLKDGDSFLSTDLGTRWWTVDAAWVVGKHLYLTKDDEYVRYTLTGDAVPAFVDTGYPKPLPQPVNAVLTRQERRYVFSGGTYAVLPPDTEPGARLSFAAVEGNWVGLPKGFDGVLDAKAGLTFFTGEHHLAYPRAAAAPYELATLPREIVRLTTSTAYMLNQRLLAGGLGALLSPETQEFNELPAFSHDVSGPTTVKVRRGRVADEHLPVASHLDFQSANSVYYWEIFFHAPLLIAQALNGAQRFEDARTWYEYVFDPTEPGAYWRFLPFLAIDVAALADACAHDLDELTRHKADVTALRRVLDPVLATLAALAPAFQRRALSDAELDDLKGLPSAQGFERALATVTGVATDEARSALNGLRERTGLITGLRRQYDLLGDPGRLIDAYRDDPFDPHAIAQLRPAAYRRAVVMAYVDNLLDWGDLLFRQYTGESIDEARMLYIFAYDLLGERPEHLAPRALPDTETYAELLAGKPAKPVTAEGMSAELDVLTAGGELLVGPGAVHGSVADRYFYVPGNDVFAAYWDRVEDRLRKIRLSLDIMGVSRPVPLFEPPIDPMALVRAVAAGIEPGAFAAGAQVPVPHHRFSFVLRKAQELADRLRGLGGDLVGVLERRDADELNLLQARQEATILAMTRAIKEAQVRAAAEALSEVEAGREAVTERISHYERLIEEGLTPLQEAQISMMAMASSAHFVASGFKIAAAVAHGMPQILAGLFITGIKHGGDAAGNALDKTGEISESMGEGLGMLGELLGIRAEQERTAEDWAFQLATARNDLVQAGHQVVVAEYQLAIAQRELDVLVQEIAHREALDRFMKGRFVCAELYGWMAGRLSAMYFQTYDLAYELARSAERAFRFERGVPDSEPSYIQPVYWESRRGGLMSGESLTLDLDRLAKAWADADDRGLEIVKKVSLARLDPVALLRLKSTGACEFTLTEALFDHDFPGHYRRQIRTVSVGFVAGESWHPGLSAMLTQVGHKTVLTPDPRAVKHLLDPAAPAPDTLRSDWRASQQIALSQGTGEDHGVFEPRFDDDRYLPFEGTGAVSTWRLDLTGRRSAERPEELRDVLITVKYAARQGGETFAGAVRGMLRPYQAGRYFEVAADFPEQWAEFLGGDARELVLTLTPDMFPSMTGHQIAGVFPAYETAGGSARFVLNGDRNAELRHGTYVPTPGLSAGRDLVLTLDGDKSALRGLGLVLTYQAGVQ